MEAKPVLLLNNEREIDLNNAEHLEKVRAFCRENFGTFQTKSKNEETIRYFACCQVFCTKNRPCIATHDQSTCRTYSAIKCEYKIQDEAGLYEALIDLLKKRAAEGHKIYVPNFNLDHFEHFDDLEDAKALKKLIVEKDEIIASLKKQLKDTEVELKEVTNHYESVNDALHWEIGCTKKKLKDSEAKLSGRI